MAFVSIPLGFLLPWRCHHAVAVVPGMGQGESLTALCARPHPRCARPHSRALQPQSIFCRTCSLLAREKVERVLVWRWAMKG